MLRVQEHRIPEGADLMKRMTRRSCLQKITPYVPGKPVEEVERELGISGVIKLASNENPLGPSPQALSAVKEFLPRLNFYPDGSCYYLKEDLAARLGVEAEQVTFGNGADELITLAGTAYLDPGDEVLVADPSFSEYDFCARLMDAEVVRVPLRDYRHDLPAMQEAVTEKTRLIFICNPNNPTGTIVSRQELASFLEKIPSDILVVMDEAYYEYVTDRDYPQSLEWVQQGYHILVLRTFSKIYGLAGLRIGYGVGPQEVINDLNTVREPFNVNAAAQVAARAALEDVAYVREVYRVNREGREFLGGELKRLGLFFVPTEANFVFIDTGIDSRKLFQSLLRQGVIVRTGDIFGHDSFIRLTIGTPEQNRRFIKALEKSLLELQSR